MAAKLPHSSPRTFSESYRTAVLEPAVLKATKPDGTIDSQALLDGPAAIATAAIANAAGQPADTFLAQATQGAFDAAQVAAGADGRLSKTDAEQLPQDLRLAFHFMKTGALPVATPPAVRPTSTSGGIPVRYSQTVFSDVMQRYALTDPQALVDRAALVGDKNAYLNRQELQEAAEALRTNAPDLSTFRWSDSVVDRVLQKFGLGDRQALLQAATRFDLDGNRYLKTSELEAAAKSLTGALEALGIVSDIDKTLLPPQTGTTLPPPYPGVTQLIR